MFLIIIVNCYYSGLHGHHPSYDLSSSGSGEVLKPEPLTMSGDEGPMGCPEDDEVPSPTHQVPRGPSPEPKIEDVECHRSQSAMYVFFIKSKNVF